jgi:hypothetical protein
VVGKTGSRGSAFQRAALRRAASQTSDIHTLFSPKMNRFFNRMSFLNLYQEADWIPDRISDEEVPIPSCLAAARMTRTRHVIDPETGKRVIGNTTLVDRSKALGFDDKAFNTLLNVRSQSGIDPAIYTELLNRAPEGYRTAYDNSKMKPAYSEMELLGILKIDILNDICGQVEPLSSLNYFWATVQIMLLFSQIEDALKSVRNPLWVRVYEEDPIMMREKRGSLTGLALALEDEECLRIMAQKFEDGRIGFMSHIYWDTLLDPEGVSSMLKSDDVEPSCTVM